MRQTTPSINRLALAIAIAAGSTAIPAAFAQESAGGLEEILVTARKREENIQDVAVAVTALSQTEIDRTFARDLKDLASMAPNLVIDDTSQGPGGVAAIYIRGVGVADVEVEDGCSLVAKIRSRCWLPCFSHRLPRRHQDGHRSRRRPL